MSLTPNTMNRTCVTCKSPFVVSPSRANGLFYKNCSRACADKSRRKIISSTCSFCKKVFLIRPSIKKYSNLKHCSWKCRYSYPKTPQKPPQKKNKCKICSKPALRKFCSHKCVAVAWRGSGNPCWRGGVSKTPYDYRISEELKNEIRERDQMT